MLFFQTTLLLGYLYAHFLSKKFKPAKQVIIHSSLLFITLVTLSILPDSSWKPNASDNPIFHIFILLSFVVGLPAIILSASSPLIQNWITNIKTKESPYYLYSLSNAGSLIALVGFPFLFENFFTIKTQFNLWSKLFFIFAFLFIFCAILLWKFKTKALTENKNINNPEKENRPKFRMYMFWFGLSTCTSILLLAVTNKISQDMSVVPFFWVIPLSLYLISFIIPFSSDSIVNWFIKNILYIILISFLFTCGFFIIVNFANFKVWQITAYLILLFLFSLACHVRLVKLKPDSLYLTNFYLMIAAGGVFGAILTVIVAPLVFKTYLELPLILLLCLLAVSPLFIKNKKFLLDFFKRQNLRFKNPVFTIPILSVIYLIVSGISLLVISHKTFDVVFKEKLRNFYGTLKVSEGHDINPKGDMLFLISGDVIHGSQFEDASMQKFPTTYYSENSGIGLTFNYFAQKNIRVGAIGLGAGTIAAYGKKGDYFKFYEINPDVVYLTNKYFTFLKNSQAEVKIVLGDARLSLENENPQNFDLLVVDAFTGDSIPVHLLTKEAFEIYLKHLKPDGIIAFDISNRYLNLKPVILNLAKNFNMYNAGIYSTADEDMGITPASWILLSKDFQVMQWQGIKENRNNLEDEIAKLDQYKLWTDDYSNLFSVLVKPF